MKLPTNYKIISDFCLTYNLSLQPELSYWLSFGFPKDMIEIEIDKYLVKSKRQTI